MILAGGRRGVAEAGEWGIGSGEWVPASCFPAPIVRMVPISCIWNVMRHKIKIL